MFPHHKQAVPIPQQRFQAHAQGARHFYRPAAGRAKAPGKKH